MAVFHTPSGRQYSSVAYNLPCLKEDTRVIVIGSGPAGAMAAHQLRQQSIPVVMLEAGVDRPKGRLVRVRGRNVYRNKPDINEVPSPDFLPTGDPNTEWHYSYSLGGLSNFWTGAVPRFAPEDFYEGARLHERYRWPITYEQLASYYDSAEKLMRVTGSRNPVANLSPPNIAASLELPEDWQRVAHEASLHGHGLTVLPLADGRNWLYSSNQGTAFNSFTGLVESLQSSTHFKLIKGARAERLEWNPSKKCVDAVIYRDVTTNEQVKIRGAAVVVACGALNSARLLLNSTSSTFPHGLGNEHGVLGRYLHDHPREWWTFQVGREMTPLSPAAYMTRQAYADSEPLLAASCTLGLVRSVEQAQRVVGLKLNKISVQIFGTMIPSEKHYVELSNSTDSNDNGLAQSLPKLKVNIAYDEPTVANIMNARRRLLGIMGGAGFDAVPDEIDRDQLRPGTSVHYGGTVRMHDSAEWGMLNGFNRVHAVPNVLVCDASAFTTGVEKNPTLTAMADGRTGGR